MAREFAANLIAGINRLYSRLNVVDVQLAKELLRATYEDYPRPAWNTGQLRSSGAVYIGGRLIATTSQTGANPGGSWALHGQSGRVDQGAGPFILKELHIRKIRSATTTAGTEAVTSLRGKITVIYNSPVAAMMHEWAGGFSDDESGPHYITAKFLTFDAKLYEAFREVFR